MMRLGRGALRVHGILGASLMTLRWLSSWDVACSTICNRYRDSCRSQLPSNTFSKSAGLQTGGIATVVVSGHGMMPGVQPDPRSWPLHLRQRILWSLYSTECSGGAVKVGLLC